VRQIGGIAHVVDRMANGPVRRHRDELRLHPPACGILRIKQAPLQRDALGRRQLFEDLLLVLLVEPFEQLDGIVGCQFANALRDRLRFEFLEYLLADGIVDLVQRREVEIGAGQFDQRDAVVGFEGRDQSPRSASCSSATTSHNSGRSAAWMARVISSTNSWRSWFSSSRIGRWSSTEPCAASAWATSIFSAMPRLAGLTE